MWRKSLRRSAFWVSGVSVNSIDYVVNISIPAYLWCSMYRSDEDTPSIRELKRKKARFGA